MNHTDLELHYAQKLNVLAGTLSGLALRRRTLAKFRCHSVVVEEAGKITETESLVLFFLLPRRLVLVGDTLQLSPIIRNEQLRCMCNYDQSMFERLHRLGARMEVLDRQGRARPAIADLYRWRYGAAFGVTLGDLDFVRVSSFDSNPPGLLWASQFVHIDGQNSGEINAEESRMIRCLVHFLVRRGNPGSSISVLTPYNRQKMHLAGVMRHFADGPRDICTTDEFQGKENTIVIVSLVLSGWAPSPHLRDPQRLNVLTSRARRALVVVGNAKTFLQDEQWKLIVAHMSTQSTVLSVEKRPGESCEVPHGGAFERLLAEWPSAQDADPSLDIADSMAGMSLRGRK